MENEKRLIWDEDAKRHLIALATGHHTETLHIDMILNAILYHTTTVDAVPVVHGRWIKGDGLKNTKFIPCSSILYCSNCKNEAYWDTDYGQQKFDYCPNCGAKMDGDGNG